jgi:hypothetical protein
LVTQLTGSFRQEVDEALSRDTQLEFARPHYELMTKEERHAQLSVPISELEALAVIEGVCPARRLSRRLRTPGRLCRPRLPRNS